MVMGEIVVSMEVALGNQSADNFKATGWSRISL
jgi:hypothetical protein